MSKERQADGNPISSPDCRVQLLGPYRISTSSSDDSGAAGLVWASEILGAKPAALLAFLLLHKRPVDRIELARLFWPDSTDERARHSLREALRRIRRAVGGEPFLRSDPVELDDSRFQTDVDTCLEALRGGDLDGALASRSGPLLEDLMLDGCWGFEEWKEQERRVFDGELAGALHARAAASPPSRDPMEILRDYLKAVEILPSRQVFWADSSQTVMALESLDSAETLLGLATGESPEELVEQLRAWVSKRRHGEGAGSSASSKLMERDKEEQQLRVSLHRAQGGQGSVLAIMGPPGIGKTSILDWLEAEVGRWPGTSFVRISARPVDRLLPWSLAGDLIAALSELPGASGTSQGSDEVLSLLRPSLKRREGSTDLNGSLDSRVYVAAFADATTDLLGAVSAETPLVLAFDDIHEMDVQSQELLVRLSRSVARLPVMLVFTGDEALATGSVLTGLQNGHTQDPILGVRLRPLSSEALSEILAAVEPEEERDRIGALSGGIPAVALALSEGGEAWERMQEAWIQHIQAHHELSGLQAQVPPVFRKMIQREEDRRAGKEGAPAQRSPWRSRSVWAISMGISITILAILAFLNHRSAPPYGGGEIHLRYVDGTSVVYSLRERTWREVALDSDLSGNRIHGPFRSVSGADVWVETTSTPNSGPDALRVLPGGVRQVIYASPGDDTFQDVSPDGRYALIVAENLETPAFDRDVVMASLDDGRTRRLFRSQHGFLVASWSRDGERILVQERGVNGELAVLSPSGSILNRYGPMEIQDATWCGPGSDILVVAVEDGQRVVSIVNETGEWRKVLSRSALRIGPCSPDGSALLAWIVQDGEWILALLSAIDGSILERVEGGRSEFPVFMRWYADSEPPVPTGMVLSFLSEVVPWGGQLPLTAHVRLSNGAEDRSREIQWQSSDPMVASVTPRGVVIGNRPGTTWITGTVAGWISDSVEVTVEPGRPPTLLLYDSFPDLDQGRWRGVGSPIPVVERSRWLDRPTLHLNGDGTWVDGLLSTEPVSLPRGGVLEVEFRMHISREDRQQIRLCMAPEGLLQVNSDNNETLEGLGGAICLRYPAGDLSFFSDRTPALAVGQWWDRFPPIESLPSDDWIVLGISVRPDGYVSAEVNRIPIGTSSLRIPDPMPDRWIIGLFGKDVDTRLEVRSLALWDGARESDETSHPDQDPNQENH